ncbi:hypothetical protein ABRY23_00210 [Melioribacteraceae bacterium 4301-Me]|uniref:hypothetical protein n=1 Tax=Pyranulibacter aquaticus TaxID=3163344 RepID=UPI003597680D
MKINLRRIAAVLVTTIFSLLTIAEGSKVLLGITVQDYKVFKPLLVYNVILGVVGLFVGVAIWLNHTKAVVSIITVLIMHSAVLVIVIALYFLSNAVAIHSVQAMIVRVVVWLVIFILVWKLNQSKAHNKNNEEQINKGYPNEN